MLTQPAPGQPAAGSDQLPQSDATFERPSRLAARPWHVVLHGGLTSLLVVLGVTTFVIAELHPGLLFAQTMDVGGDNAAHVVAVNYFIHDLLPHGQLAGWDPQWFGGFPLYVFYFPLPPVIAAALTSVFSYAVAFKLVSVLGTVLTPVAAWTFGRLAGFRKPIPELMCVATLAFLFNTSYTIDGGNIVSTMAGEFSFSLAVSLSLFFLGVFVFALRTGRLRWLAAVLYLLTLVSHVVPGLFATGAAAVFAVASYRRRAPATVAPGDASAGDTPAETATGVGSPTRWRPGGRLPQPLVVAVSVGVVGALLAAFWLVPFAAELRYSASMGYTRVTGFVPNFLPGTADNVVVAIGGAGAILALARRDRIAIALAVLAGLDLLAFFFLPSGLVYNARWLPFWFLLVSLLAGYAIAVVCQLVLGLLPGTGAVDWAATIPPIVLAVVAIAVVAGYLGQLPGFPTAYNETEGWVTFNYTGYQEKPGWPELQQLVAMMERVAKVHGCGRLDYEYSADQPNLANVTDYYGSTLWPMSFPMWTDGCIQSMEGVYYESSTAIYTHFLDQAELSLDPSNPVVGLPYPGLNVADGIRHLQLDGVKYFLASSPTVETQAAADPDLVLVGQSPESPLVIDRTPGTPAPPATTSYTYDLYLIKDAPIVAPLSEQPVVEHLSKLAWNATSVSWYQDETDWHVPIAASGPASWETMRPGTLTQDGGSATVGQTTVSHVVMGNEQVSFDVSRLGVPIEVKVPYFPNWEASGASGPYEVTPDFMVVVPSAHHVTLTYATTAVGWAGRAGSLLGVVGLAALVRVVPPPPARPRRSAEVRTAPESEEDADPDAAPAGDGDLEDGDDAPLPPAASQGAGEPPLDPPDGT